MSTYGYDRLTGFTKENLEVQLHELFNRKDASGKPDVVTVTDLQQVIHTLVDAMTELDGWVIQNGGR